MPQDQETTSAQGGGPPKGEEASPAMLLKAPQTAAPELDQGPRNADLEQIRRDQYELRDKLNNLRENDLFALKEKTSSLNAKFAAAAVIIALVGFFGIKLYFFDLNSMIEGRIKERTDKLVSYNEKFVRASTLVQLRAYDDAIAIYQELYDENPEDEVLFYSLLNTLDSVDRYDDAMKPINFARQKGYLRSQYKHILSYNNAGYFMLIRSFEEASLRPEAAELLHRAEDIGLRTDNRYLRHVVYNLTVYYAMVGKLDQARKYGQRFRSFENANWEWSPDREAPWLLRLQKVKPSINEDLKTAFAK